MRFKWIKIGALALLAGASALLFAQTKINPNTQINWPASCAAGPFFYNFATQTCIPGGGVTFTGPWSSTTNYGTNVGVSYNGSQFVSIQSPNFNQNPASATTYWALYAAGGGGATTPATSNLLKGTGSVDGVVAATPGTDYVIPSGNTATATALAATPALCSGVQLATGIAAIGTAQCRNLTSADTGSVGEANIGSAAPAYPSVASAIAAGFTSLTLLPATALGGFANPNSYPIFFTDLLHSHANDIMPEQWGAAGDGVTIDTIGFAHCMQVSGAIGATCRAASTSGVSGGGYYLAPATDTNNGNGYALASVVNSEGFNTFTGIVGFGANNGLGGMQAIITGCGTVNNGTWTIAASTATTLIVANSDGSSATCSGGKFSVVYNSLPLQSYMKLVGSTSDNSVLLTNGFNGPLFTIGTGPVQNGTVEGFQIHCNPSLSSFPLSQGIYASPSSGGGYFNQGGLFNYNFREMTIYNCASEGIQMPGGSASNFGNQGIELHNVYIQGPSQSHPKALADFNGSIGQLVWDGVYSGAAGDLDVPTGGVATACGNSTADYSNALVNFSAVSGYAPIDTVLKDKLSIQGGCIGINENNTLGKLSITNAYFENIGTVVVDAFAPKTVITNNMFANSGLINGIVQMSGFGSVAVTYTDNYEREGYPLPYRVNCTAGSAQLTIGGNTGYNAPSTGCDYSQQVPTATLTINTHNAFINADDGATPITTFDAPLTQANGTAWLNAFATGGHTYFCIASGGNILLGSNTSPLCATSPRGIGLVKLDNGSSQLWQVTSPNPLAPLAVTATKNPNATSITCAIATCTSTRGSYTVVGGTATTGTILSLAWTATQSAYICSSWQNGGTSFLGIGNSVATTTGFNITAGVSVSGVTFTVNYECVP